MVERLEDGVIVLYVLDGVAYPMRIPEIRNKNIQNAFPNLLGGINNVFIDMNKPQGEAFNSSEDIDYIEIELK